VKKSTPFPRASHVNDGTSVPHDELPWPEHYGPVIRSQALSLEADTHAPITAFGGLVLVNAFLRRFKVARRLDAHVHVLKLNLPYFESDHILAHALNLYVGGTCIEDMSKLQGDDAVLRMLRACRLPDPTTGGDFLRRFDPSRNPAALDGLRRATDEVQDEVWGKLAGKNKRKQPRAVIDMDGHLKEVYGSQKENADFDRKGRLGFHPLLMSLAGTGECLSVRLRSGNVTSYDGADEELDRVLPRVKNRFREVLVRGDSHFDQASIREACERHGVHFAFVSPSWVDRPGKAAKIKDWRPFETRARRFRKARAKRKGYKRRHRGKQNVRRRRVEERGYKNLDLVKQWVAEVPYTPNASDRTYRLIVRKQLIDETRGAPGQREIWHRYRYRFVITNLPKSWSAEDVIDETYQRADQENLIEQMSSALPAWRMPVAEFAGNQAWTEIARLAWNMRKWIEQLALPEEVRRWEWKRFRFAYVVMAAKVVHKARQVVVRLAGSHRMAADLIEAHAKLQT